MKHIPWKTALGSALSAGLIAAPLAAVPAFAVEVSPAAGTSPVIINEAYLSGGSAGAAYKNKFVELYNTSDTPVSLDGWSLQYRSATGAAAPSATAALTGSIPAKGYYLLKGGANGGTAAVGAELPAADATATGFNPGGAGGTIVLAKQSTVLGDLATGSVVEQGAVADLLGYGTSNTFETQAAAAPKDNNDVKSLNRGNGADSNNNSADFTLNAAITPKAANGAAAPVDPPVDPGPVTPPATKTIAEIQGNGAASPLAGTSVTTRARSPPRSRPAGSPATTSRPPAPAAI
jgi:5'-nucleotidase